MVILLWYTGVLVLAGWRCLYTVGGGFGWLVKRGGQAWKRQTVGEVWCVGIYRQGMQLPIGKVVAPPKVATNASCVLNNRNLRFEISQLAIQPIASCV